MKKICSSLFGYLMAFIFVVCAATPMLHAQDAEEEDMLDLLFKSNGYAQMSPSERASLLLLNNEERSEIVLDNVLFLKDISSIFNITFNPAHYSIDSLELFTSPSIAQYYYDLAMSANPNSIGVFDTVALPEDVAVDVYFSIHDSSNCVTDEANNVQCPLTRGILLNILNAYYSCTPAQRAIFYDTFCNPNNNSEVVNLFRNRLSFWPTPEQQLSFVDMVPKFDLESVDDGNGNLDAFLYGGLPGVFTINANGSKVHFAKGNIQYRASTNEWRFADNQYDFIGDGNSNISATYDGWIDLFGWGSGDTAITPPYTYDQSAMYGSNDERNINSTTSDWGFNPISNAGNEISAWRTLRGSEWYHLLSQRSNMPRFVKSRVNGIDGLILFPDNFNTDSSGYSFQYVNDSESSRFSYNIISLGNWAKLDSLGCVFLPAAGRRDGTSYCCSGSGATSSDGSYGAYWSASSISDSKAYFISFNNNSVGYGTGETIDKYNGFSVRLVRDVTAQPTGLYMNDSQSGNGPAEGATGGPTSDGTVTDDNATPRGE